MLKKETIWKQILSRKFNYLGHEENSEGVILATTFLFGAGDN